MGAATSVSTPIAEVVWRELATVTGSLRSIRIVRDQAGQSLELAVYDETGGLIAGFTGRNEIGGVELGARVELSGRIGDRRGHFAMLNPTLRLLPRAH
jgi:hypothetical protein